MPRILAALCLLALTAPALADDWADSAGDDPAYAASRRICRRAKAVALPRPDPAVPAAKGCDAQALYDGGATPPDDVAARACALAAWNAPGAGRDDPIGSAGVLAMLYANGRGVTRDYDIAIGYACRLDGAPAEMDGRIQHLAALKAKGPGETPFDVCDDATSGQLGGLCAERQADVAEARRAAAIAQTTKDLDAAHKASFAKLAAAEKRFVDTLADNEVDVSGTLRVAFIVEARDKHEAAFAATLKAALAGTLPGATPAALAQADAALNKAYAALLALKDTSGLGTIDKKGIKATQRGWLAYRDAFAAFVAGTPTTADAVRAALTRQRTEDLTALSN